MQVHGMSPNIPSPKVRDMATPHISDMQKHTVPMGEKGAGKFLLSNNPDEVLATVSVKNQIVNVLCFAGYVVPCN